MSPDEKIKKAESLVGTPFQQLPGKPPQHKVLGQTSDGHPIRVSDVEMAWNDAWLMDQINGEGDYEASLVGDPDPISIRTLEVYRLAKELYAK